MCGFTEDVSHWIPLRSPHGCWCASTSSGYGIPQAKINCGTRGNKRQKELSGADMNIMKKGLLLFAVGAFSAILAQAANAPQTATVISENSVNCGEQGGKKSID